MCDSWRASATLADMWHHLTFISWPRHHACVPRHPNLWLSLPLLHYLPASRSLQRLSSDLTCYSLSVRLLAAFSFLGPALNALAAAAYGLLGLRSLLASAWRPLVTPDRPLRRRHGRHHHILSSLTPAISQSPTLRRWVQGITWPPRSKPALARAPACLATARVAPAALRASLLTKRVRPL